MLSTYISSSLTQLIIYNQFLRANYKEFGLSLHCFWLLFVSLNAMAGDSVGAEVGKSMSTIKYTKYLKPRQR